MKDQVYTNTKPWEGLGVDVLKQKSVDGMLKAAKLDWDVEKRPLGFADTEEGEIKKYTGFKGHYALVRDSDNEVLDVAGNHYTPIQNKQAFSFFKEYVEAGDAKMEVIGSLRGGRIIWGLADLGASFALRGNDVVKGYLLVCAPHVAGKSFVAKITTLRPICQNTLNLALRKGGQEFRMAHRSKLDDVKIKSAKETLGIAREQISEFHETAKKLQKMRMGQDDAVEILAQVYQPDTQLALLKGDKFLENASPRMKQLVDILHRAPGAQPDNGWGVLNAVTYYADHVASRTADKRLANAWLGKTSNQKDKVLDLLLKAA